MPKPDKQKTQEMSALALGAFKRFGLKESGGYPELRIVDRTHDMLGGKRHARAVMYESGPPSVYLSRRAYTTRPQTVDEYLQHEASHIAAWRKYGYGIQEHGKEWRDLCLAMASSPRVCKTER